jgi:hypothetical protein
MFVGEQIVQSTWADREQRRGLSFTDKKAMAVRNFDRPWGLLF